jgi:serine/threonine-protein kinase
MGEVWRARDTTLGRDVALKILPDHLALDPDRLARFKREAQILASLNHPNIAAIYGLQESDGVQALVLELVEGPTLAERLAQGSGLKAQGIPLEEALPIAKQIAEALEAAHEQGIVHRDLKPANIKLRPDGTVKVLDFGLAKALEPTAAAAPSGLSMSPTITSPAATHVGVILGTAAYMSPEQARGKAIDKRADIWAFGCVFYEMLTGRRPFSGDDVTDTIAAVIRGEPQWTALPSAIPPRLLDLLHRCLEKDPRQRVRDIGDVRLELARVFDGGGAEAAQPTAGAPAMWQRPLPVAAAASILCGLIAVVTAWGLWPTAEPRAVTRFSDTLPAGQELRRTGRSVFALSPDGRAFVYNTTAGLYLRTMNELAARVIPGTEADLAAPVFSPDGQQVAYWDAGDQQIKRIAVSGGAPVVVAKVAANPYGVSWGVDGTILVGQPQGILRVPATGGTADLIIKSEQGELFCAPQLLPDGDSVLLSVASITGPERWNTARVAVHSLSSGKRTIVVEGGSDARYLPTGHLVYALEDGLFAVAFDAGRATTTGGAVPLVQGVMRSGNATCAAHYGVSGNGTLAYTAGVAAAAMRTLVWVDRQGREEPINVPPRAYVYAQLSRDGRLVALDSRDEENDIWIWDLVRQTLQRLTFDPGSNRSPLWAPDGQRLAFSRATEGTDEEVYWQAADGSGTATALTEGSKRAMLPGDFSPDGASLFYQEDGPPHDVWMVPVDGPRTAGKALLAGPANEYNATVSPGGDRLAYQSDESGRYEIYVRPFPDVDTGKRQISTDGGTRPRWSRDGRELFYFMNSGFDAGALMAVPVEPGTSLTFGRPTMLFQGNYPSPNTGRGLFDVSPDGQRFLMIKNVEGGEAARPQIVVVENWDQELKRLVPTR